VKAVMFVPRAGGADVEVREVEKPAPAAGEALVRVRAAGLNRGELVTRSLLVSGAPRPTGIEFAGEVAALGAPQGKSGSRFKPGDRVMGHWQAGQAEYVAADERLLVPVPQRLSWIQAAAWLNVFVTAHDAIVTNAALKSGESILVNAASSGIGVAALQIARLIGAKPILASSRSKAKLAKLAAYGMQVGIEAGAGSAAAVMEATGKKGVDVLVDSVGGGAGPESNAQSSMEAMAVLGRWVSVGRLGGNRGEIDLDMLAFKRVKLIGVTFRTRSKEERIACVQAAARDLWEALAEGRLEPAVHRVFPMSEVKAAHAEMEKNEHIGKLVLEIA